MHPSFRFRRVSWLPALALLAPVVTGGAACPLFDTGSSAGLTRVDGTPYGVGFEGASAGHKIEHSGATALTVVRIAPRSDLCEAVLDPIDTVDPSLVITINGTQVQDYQVVGLDYAGPPGGGRPPPTATVTLQTFEHCSTGPGLDAGTEDAGPQCAVNRAAHSGLVQLEALEEGGRAKGNFSVEFPEGGGAASGVFDAPTCIQIR
ncbi:MAG: hypothetical protein ABIJ09_15450 [Pseudomonadota bacterium]